MLPALPAALEAPAAATAAAKPAAYHPTVITEQAVQFVHSCNQDVSAGHVACFAERRVDPAAQPQAAGVTPMISTPPGLHPGDLAAAYGLPTATGGEGQTVYVVDAFDDPAAESDLAMYRSTFGLPPCTTANGCFRKLNSNGLTGPLPGAGHRLGGRDLAGPRHGLRGLPQLQHHPDRGHRHRHRDVHGGAPGQPARGALRLDELGWPRDRRGDDGQHGPGLLPADRGRLHGGLRRRRLRQGRDLPGDLQPGGRGGRHPAHRGCVDGPWLDRDGVVTGRQRLLVGRAGRRLAGRREPVRQPRHDRRVGRRRPGLRRLGLPDLRWPTAGPSTAAPARRRRSSRRSSPSPATRTRR